MNTNVLTTDASQHFENRNSVIASWLKNVAAKIGAGIQALAAPTIALLIFLMLWSAAAGRIHTSLGQVPGPAQVWSQAMGLLDEHIAERKKEVAFYERQEKRNAAKLAKNPDAKIKTRA